MKIRIRDLHEVCLQHPGMWDAFWQAGKRVEDCLQIERGDFERINTAFQLGTAGTVLHAVLEPLAKATDTLLGTKLQECPDCGGRELKINAATATPAKDHLPPP